MICISALHYVTFSLIVVDVFQGSKQIRRCAQSLGAREFNYTPLLFHYFCHHRAKREATTTVATKDGNKSMIDDEVRSRGARTISDLRSQPNWRTLITITDRHGFARLVKTHLHVLSVDYWQHS